MTLFFQIGCLIQPKIVLTGSWLSCFRSLDGVAEEVLASFTATASRLVEERGAVPALAAALAVISGSTSLKKRSLLNAREVSQFIGVAILGAGTDGVKLLGHMQCSVTRSPRSRSGQKDMVRVKSVGEETSNTAFAFALEALVSCGSCRWIRCTVPETHC